MKPNPYSVLSTSLRALLSGMNPVDEPVFTDAGESSLTQELELPGAIPILPLRNTVLFPGVIIPITVARPKSIHLVRTVARDQSFVGLIAQKTPGVEEPVTEDLYASAPSLKWCGFWICLTEIPPF